MLKWLKDAGVKLLLAEVQRNAKRYEEIIELLRSQSKQILELNRKADKNMSELSDAVAAIANDVTELQDAQKRVIDLLTKPNPDVAAAVEGLRAADAGFDAIRDALNNAGRTTAEPPAEG